MTHIIKLAGPDGNAYAIAGLARNWLQQLGEDRNKFKLDGCNSYNEVLDQFDKVFKGRIDYVFIGDPRPSNDEADWAEYQHEER